MCICVRGLRRFLPLTGRGGGRDGGSGGSRHTACKVVVFCYFSKCHITPIARSAAGVVAKVYIYIYMCICVKAFFQLLSLPMCSSLLFSKFQYHQNTFEHVCSSYPAHLGCVSGDFL